MLWLVERLVAYRLRRQLTALASLASRLPPGPAQNILLDEAALIAEQIVGRRTNG